jgi:hypothetical protein
VRISAVLLLIVSLAACNRATKNNNDAVRQGVVDYLVSKGFDIPKAMTVTVTKVDMNGPQADATVAISPAGGDPKQGMTMVYRLEQKGEKWAVVGKPGGGDSPHEGANAMPAPPPGGSAPHGGGAPGAAGGTKMPSPDDLPPAKK